MSLGVGFDVSNAHARPIISNLVEQDVTSATSQHLVSLHATMQIREHTSKIVSKPRINAFFHRSYSNFISSKQ